jgi:ABC-type amino acid transport substrate-binding protein
MRRTLRILALSFSAVAVGLAAAAAQTPQGGRLKAIAAAKTIKIAYRSDAAPFSFVSEQQKNEPIGYTIDVCKLVVASMARQLGAQTLRIEWVPVTTQNRFEAVSGGKADMECGASTVTLARMKQVDFSNYVFIESTGLVVRTEAGIAGIKDAAGKKIAVIAGTSNEKALAQVDRQFQLNLTLVAVKDRDEAIAALGGARVDGFASDKLLLVGARFQQAQLRLLPDDLSVEPYAIALPRGDWEMRLAVNTGLAEIYRSGEAGKLFDRWFGQLGLRPGVLLGAAYLLGGLSD